MYNRYYSFVMLLSHTFTTANLNASNVTYYFFSKHYVMVLYYFKTAAPVPSCRQSVISAVVPLAVVGRLIFGLGFRDHIFLSHPIVCDITTRFISVTIILYIYIFFIRSTFGNFTPVTLDIMSRLQPEQRSWPSSSY